MFSDSHHFHLVCINKPQLGPFFFPHPGPEVFSSIELKKCVRTHTHKDIILFCKLISMTTERESVCVREQAASHTEWLAVGLHISALNVKHMLTCGWESRE